MVKNYIKVALRNLLKNRVFSFINIFGLAMGISVCLVLIMLVADQKNNDKYNTNSEKIYRITHDRINSDEFVSLYATAPLPLADKLTSEYDDVETAVRIRRGFGNDWIGVEDNVNIPIGGYFADNDFLKLFQLELLHGDKNTALIKPNSVVLKEEAVNKLFDKTDVVGNIITVGELGDFLITGVIKDNNEQSHIKFEALASFSSLIKIEEQDSILYASANNWENRTSGWVYVQLKDGVSKSTVEDHLEFINKEIYSEMDDFEHKFALQPITSISPGPLTGNEIGPVLPLIFIYFLSGLAFVVMLSASFNYMNLSIARSLTRAREVGIRKVSGANKSQLIGQFLIEASILSLIALIFSYLILILLKPAFVQLHFAQLLQWDLRIDSSVILFSILFSLGVGLLAGLIPAYTLATFQTSKVLKDLSGIKLFSRLGLRKFLIISQFSLSLVFIISAILVNNQLRSMVSADFGFNTSDIINVRLNNTPYTQLRTELNKYPGVTNVTAASHIPASGTTRSHDLKKSWEDDLELEMPYFDVDENYLDILKLELAAGTNFQKLDLSANEIIINEKAVETYDLGTTVDAIGKFLYDVDDSIVYSIVGVIKNYHHQMLIMEMSPMMLRYRPENTVIAHVEFISNIEKSDRNEIIDKVFAEINPGLKADHTPFADELTFYYNLLFGDIVTVVAFATFLAIVIACLGMLGIATYTIETRTKEVGVRKVLGASGLQLILQLSKGFASILVIAIIIAIPVAYVLNNLWLQQFAFRVDITIGVISLGVLILLVLGGLTIGSQTYRASTINPVDSLRNE